MSKNGGNKAEEKSAMDTFRELGIGDIALDIAGSDGEPDVEVCYVDIALIRPYKSQPRKRFKQEGLDSLSKSIKEKQLQAITLVRLSDLYGIEEDAEGYKFELVDGERRWRSGKMAGKKKLLSIIRKVANENEQFLISCISNYGKEDHSEIEIAESAERIIADFGFSVAEVAMRFCMSPQTLRNYMSLLILDKEVQQMLMDERITCAAALQLIELPPKSQKMLAEKYAKGEANSRMIAHLARKEKKRLGIKSTKRRSPADDYNNLKAFLKRTDLDIFRFLDMPAEGFRAMFKYRLTKDRNEMYEMIEKVLKGFQKIKERV